MLQQEDVERLKERIIERAGSDSEYRKRLITDPRAALKELGIDLPPAFNVTVLESTATSHYLVLPPLDSDELSDEDLEAVAGGGCWTFLRRKKSQPDGGTDGSGSEGGGHDSGGIDGYEDAKIADLLTPRSSTDSDDPEGIDDNTIPSDMKMAMDKFMNGILDNLGQQKSRGLIDKLDDLDSHQQDQLAQGFMEVKDRDALIKRISEDPNMSFEDMDDAIKMQLRQEEEGVRPPDRWDLD